MDTQDSNPGRLTRLGAGEQEPRLTLEQHRFELHRSTYTWMFFNKYTGKCFGDLQQFEKSSQMNYTA